MKIKKWILLSFVLVFTVFFMTACSDNTAQIADKNGKSITVSSPVSDTYTFQLPAVQTPVVTEETPVDTTEDTTVEPAPVMEADSDGPKTGEP